jgi:hypothetical protein
MEKKKNRPTTWLERLWDSWLNTLDDLIFLQNVHSPIGITGCMRIVYVLVIVLFCYMTISALSIGSG